MDSVAIMTLGTTVANLFGQMTNLMNRTFVSAGYQVSNEQYRILELLAQKEGVSQQELAEGLLKTKPNITHLLDQLEKKQLLTRNAHQHDRRKNLIYLTEEGKRVQQALLELIIRTFNEVFAEQIEGEYAQFIRTAQKILYCVQMQDDQ